MGIKSIWQEILQKYFKERQIYHRSDNVVHFISMSPKTQIALAVFVGAAMMWIAYASVNVVFNQQILLAQAREIESLKTFNCPIERLPQESNKSVGAFLIAPIKWIYDGLVFIINYIEPENSLVPSEKLKMFADFLKFVVSGLAVGFSWSIGTFILRKNANQQT